MSNFEEYISNYEELVSSFEELISNYEENMSNFEESISSFEELDLSLQLPPFGEIEGGLSFKKLKSSLQLL